MRIAIVNGHTAKAAGARAVAPIGKQEYFFNKDLGQRMLKACKALSVEAKMFYRDDIGIQGAYKNALAYKPDLIIELHFNAFNGKASGSEVLYSDQFDLAGLKERELAQLVQKEICKALGFKGHQDRGAKDRPRTKREAGWFNLAQTINVASILVEPFFGDNPDDALRAYQHKDELAQCMVDGCLKWFEKYRVKKAA